MKREVLKVMKIRDDEITVALDTPIILNEKWKRLWVVGAEIEKLHYPQEHYTHTQDQLILEEESRLVKFTLKVLNLPFAVIAFPVGGNYKIYGWVVKNEIEIPQQEEIAPNLFLFARDALRVLEKAIDIKKEYPWLPIDVIMATVLERENLLQMPPEKINEAITTLEKQRELLDIRCNPPSNEQLVLLEKGDRRVILVYDKPEHVFDLHGIKKGKKRFYLVVQRYGEYTTSWSWKTHDGMGQFYSEYEVGFIRTETHYGWHATSPEEWDEEDDNLLSQAQRRMEEDAVKDWMQEWRNWEEAVKTEDERSWRRGKLYATLGLPFSPDYSVFNALEELKRWQELLGGGK